MIDKMQNYYGIAIRSNTGNLEAIKKNVLATLFHCASNDEHPWHSSSCPPSKDSWCGYTCMHDKALNTKTYKHGKGLPRDVTQTLKPVYATLSNDTLLRKCLDGKTQNQNESFNGMIWQCIPKTVFVGSDVFQVGVYDADAHFNIGERATTKVLDWIQEGGTKLEFFKQIACECIRLIIKPRQRTKREERSSGGREKRQGTRITKRKERHMQLAHFKHSRRSHKP